MSDIDQDISKAKKEVELLEYKKKIKDLKNDIDSPSPTSSSITPVNPANPSKYQILIASDRKRLVNYLVDLFFVYVITTVLWSPGHYNYSNYNATGYDANWYITLWLVLFFYYAVSEGVTGKTIGKLLTRTRVVNEKGNPAGLDLIVARSIVRLIPFDTLSFLGGKYPRGWHDKWSKTIVIDEDVDNYTGEEGTEKTKPQTDVVKAVVVAIALFIAFISCISILVFVANPPR